MSICVFNILGQKELWSLFIETLPTVQDFCWNESLCRVQAGMTPSLRSVCQTPSSFRESSDQTHHHLPNIQTVTRTSYFPLKLGTDNK